MKEHKLPDTELKIMQVIWCIQTPASTSAIREELQKEKPWNLSALQTLLGRLVRRGFLQTEKQGKNRYYTPVISEEEYLAEDSRRYFQKWTGGSLRDLVACLYENHSVTKEELEDLRAFIEDETKG
nr:BlaI/MecI/CopY family transcriptional regulator [uncultured Anaerotignum sp.]